MLAYPSLVSRERFKKAERARTALRSRRCPGTLPFFSRLLWTESPKNIHTILLLSALGVGSYTLGHSDPPPFRVHGGVVPLPCVGVAGSSLQSEHPRKGK